MPRGTAAVVAALVWVEVVAVLRVDQHSSVDQLGEQASSLCIDISIDMVGYLARVMAETDAFVECDRTGPECMANAVLLIRFPKKNVIAFAKIVADGVFEGGSSRSAPNIEAADGGVLPGATDDGGFGDLNVTTETQGVRRKPVRFLHDALELSFASAQCEVHRVPRMTVAGRSDLGEISQRWVAIAIHMPSGR